MTTISDHRALLNMIVQEAFDQETWNGTNLKSALARVPADVASWVPPGARHCIAEHVVHCAFWKYRLRRAMRNDKRGGFAYQGEDWFELGLPLTPERWQEILNLLDAEHANVCDAIATSTETLALDAEPELVRKIFGLAMHDAYHTGQIQLIKSLHKRS